MAKYYDGNFIQIPKIMDEDKFASLSLPAFKLFFYLKNLEHNYTGKKNDSFYCSTDRLVAITKLGKTSIIKAKKELVKNGLIETWQVPHPNPTCKTLAKAHISMYRILA